MVHAVIARRKCVRDTDECVGGPVGTVLLSSSCIVSFLGMPCRVPCKAWPSSKGGATANCLDALKDLLAVIVPFVHELVQYARAVCM